MYPKSFLAAKRPVRRGTSFIAMPFGKEFDPVFRCMKSALENEGISVVRTDELLGGGHVMADILEGIATCEILIADLTARNPNVFYELGIAHMCKEVGNVILISQDLESIPFDLRAFRYVLYETNQGGLRNLSRSLGESVRAVRQEVHRIFLTDGKPGALDKMLMASDHCLYSFKVLDVFSGHNAAKFCLVVERHVMGQTRRHEEEIFHDGMGLELGESRPIPKTEWSIALERAPDGQQCLTINRDDRSKVG